MSIISIEKLEKSYHWGKPNQFTALKDISMDIQARETTILAGPSGSGKTTLLSVVGLINRPTAGRLTILGRETTLLGENLRTLFRRRHLGFIFQHFQLIGDLKVKDNLDLVLYQDGLSLKSIQSRRNSLLEKLGLLDKADYCASVLSGGEKQRVAIARALMNEPEILMVDEPTAHLDTTMSVNVIDIFRTLAEEGKTLVIASHDPLILGSGIAQRVIHLRDGRVVQEA